MVLKSALLYVHALKIDLAFQFGFNAYLHNKHMMLFAFKGVPINQCPI
jgi:hypothetical protein